jgi:carboxymethylenebutenolidase
MAVLTRPEGSEPQDFNHSRRTVAGLFFAGYALAAVSADAAPIATDAQGLEAHEMRIPLKDGTYLPSYMARPAGAGRFPVVIVVSEVFGIHEYVRDVCRRFAKLGYAAVAPGFFFRAGDPAPLTDFDQIKKIVATATNEQVMGDIDAALTWLGDQDWADRKRLAITGFCWGGAVVWMACARFPEFKAGVAWYGRLAPPKPDDFGGGEKRQWPIQVAGQLHAPVLGLYAGLDKGITAESIEQMRAALKANHKQGEIVVYPDAQHGFHADYRPTYNEADARDGWVRMLGWFKRSGVGPGAKKGILG